VGIARFKFNEGKLDEFKRLSAHAMEIVRTTEPGTLEYDTYVNDDQTECVVIERYRDSEAAMEHAANLADLSAEVLATVSWFTANSSVSRVKNSERSWPAASFLDCSSPTSRCRTADRPSLRHEGPASSETLFDLLFLSSRG